MAYRENNWKLPLGLLGAGINAAGTALAGKSLAGRIIKGISTRFMTDPYKENLWEAFSAGSRTTPQVIIETNLRSELGRKIKCPLGGPKNFPAFNNIMFNPAQLHTFPKEENIKVDTSVILGRYAQKPLRLDIPILISGMAYGSPSVKRPKLPWPGMHPWPEQP